MEDQAWADTHRQQLFLEVDSSNFQGISDFFVKLEDLLREKNTLWEQLSFLFYLMFPSLESLIREIQIKRFKKEIIFQILRVCMRFIPEPQYKVFMKVHNLLLSNKMSLLHSREFLVK